MRNLQECVTQGEIILKVFKNTALIRLQRIAKGDLISHAPYDTIYLER